MFALEFLLRIQNLKPKTIACLKQRALPVTAFAFEAAAALAGCSGWGFAAAVARAWGYFAPAAADSGFAAVAAFPCGWDSVAGCVATFP